MTGESRRAQKECKFSIGRAVIECYRYILGHDFCAHIETESVDCLFPANRSLCSVDVALVAD